MGYGHSSHRWDFDPSTTSDNHHKGISSLMNVNSLIGKLEIDGGLWWLLICQGVM
jgi:hypothetical protein